MSQAEPLIRLTVHGAAGRMGQRIVALAAKDPQLSIVAAIDAPGSPSAGRDAGELAGIGKLGVPITTDVIGVDRRDHRFLDAGSDDEAGRRLR